MSAIEELRSRRNEVDAVAERVDELRSECSRMDTGYHNAVTTWAKELAAEMDQVMVDELWKQLDELDKRANRPQPDNSGIGVSGSGTGEHLSCGCGAPSCDKCHP